MQELSMNILDVAENSVTSGAKFIGITLTINTKAKSLVINIKDDGCGMPAEMVARVTDPFCTNRTTRKVGLGLPFFKMAAELTGGTLIIQSTVGKGTSVTASFTLGHIDLAPLGDVAGSIASLIQCNPNIDFVFTVLADEDTFCTDTRELREVLGEVSFALPEVAIWIREYIDENTKELLKRSITL